MKLIANKRMTYRTRRLLPGDEFEADDAFGRMFMLLKRAEPAPEHQTIAAPAYAPDDIELLRSMAERLGIEIDGRWGKRRLQAEIDNRRGA